jgi:hypothetical protein
MKLPQVQKIKQVARKLASFFHNSTILWCFHLCVWYAQSPDPSGWRRPKRYSTLVVCLVSWSTQVDGFKNCHDLCE